MVNKCAAYGCKSGYSGNTDVQDDGVKVSFHAYPLSNKELCDKWIRANPRKDFVPTKHSKLCSLHFKPSDFVEARRDTNKRRMKTYADDTGLVRRYLKDDAVPSVFQNTPNYLSNSHGGTPRSTKRATASSRREQLMQEFDNLSDTFMSEDNISHLNLTEMQDRLRAETALPSGFTVTSVSATSLLIYKVSLSNDIPTITACITVRADFCVVVSLENKIVPVSQYKHIVDGPLNKFSQLVNLMALVKSWCEEPKVMSLEMLIQMAIYCLKSGMNNMDEEQDECRQLQFLIEQLELITTNKYGRHYSPQLTVLCYMINATSAAAFTVLRDENILCLPSANTLRKVSSRLSVADGLDNVGYLSLRMSKLNEYERNVVLMIDEIYVAKRVEYSGGDVKGLTPDCSVASTLLCFMVKSIVGKYKDLVGIYPVHKLTAKKQHQCYLEVMSLLRSVAMNVVAISVDNASTNRKFFIDFLCGGNLQTQITDTVTGQPIYLIFDPVHDLKNVYNNFQSRKLFECPIMNRNLPNGCVANFHHIVELYNMESTMALKKAHRLSPAALQPKNIEKTSVRLATAVFLESTRDALQFYADNEGKDDWLGTSLFISLVVKLWNVMNVKSSAKGKQKRDVTKDPVRSSLDWKLDFLRECAEFLLRWEQSKTAGLTRETFLALRHTCLALADCASYLLDRRGLNYVLLGHLQSDAIERRFGWLRQLSGANFYISARQVLESDKKIRALSLLKFARFCLSDIDEAIQNQTNDKDSSADNVADALADSLQFKHFPSASDANIIYYVSGYIARSIVRSTRCEHCKDYLISTEQLEPIELDTSLDYSAATFLEHVNRGGLARPTDFTFLLAVHCWRVFEEIKNRKDLLEQLLHASCQRALFCKLMERVSCIQTYGHMPIYGNICVAGHDLNLLITQRFFNCVAKNLVKDITAKANVQTDSSGGKRKRKCVKLSSGGAQM